MNFPRTLEEELAALRAENAALSAELDAIDEESAKLDRAPVAKVERRRSTPRARGSWNTAVQGGLLRQLIVRAERALARRRELIAARRKQSHEKTRSRRIEGASVVEDHATRTSTAKWLG